MDERVVDLGKSIELVGLLVLRTHALQSIETVLVSALLFANDCLIEYILSHRSFYAVILVWHLIFL